MIFEHEKSFVKQIIIYFKSKEYHKAHDLGKEFVEGFPNSLMAHYLYAKACYRANELVNALAEGHRAFNLAESKEDLVGVGIFLACVYYELRRYTKGFEVLNAIAQFHDEKVEKALFILSLCMNDPNEAMMHVDALYAINKQVAGEFVDKFLGLARAVDEGPP